MKKYFDTFIAWKELDENIKIMFYVINKTTNLNFSKVELLTNEYQNSTYKIKILTGSKLAEMVLDAGLFSWLLKKSG